MKINYEGKENKNYGLYKFETSVYNGAIKLKII